MSVYVVELLLVNVNYFTALQQSSKITTQQSNFKKQESLSFTLRNVSKFKVRPQLPTRGRLPASLGITTMADYDYSKSTTGRQIDFKSLIADENEPRFFTRGMAAMEGMPLGEERARAWESLHRDALRTSLLLGIQDRHIRELKSALFFDYLVPNDYHKLLDITQQHFEFMDFFHGDAVPLLFRRTFDYALDLASARCRSAKYSNDYRLPIETVTMCEDGKKRRDEADSLRAEKGFRELMQMCTLSREHFVHINPVLRMLAHILFKNNRNLVPSAGGAYEGQRMTVVEHVFRSD